MANRKYGDRSVIITRTDADASTFGFGNTSALETFIDELMTRATSMLERYCDRRFDEVTEFEERLDGNGVEIIAVSGDPIIQIRSVAVNDSTLTQGDDFEIVEDPLAADGGTGRLRRLYGGRPGRWRPGADITVTYDFGYTDTTRPGVVAQVVEDMVVMVLNEADALRKSAGKDSESMDGYSVSWTAADAAERLDLTESMQRKLDGSVAVQGVA